MRKFAALYQATKLVDFPVAGLMLWQYILGASVPTTTGKIHDDGLQKLSHPGSKPTVKVPVSPTPRE